MQISFKYMKRHSTSYVQRNAGYKITLKLPSLPHPAAPHESDSTSSCGGSIALAHCWHSTHGVHVLQRGRGVHGTSQTRVPLSSGNPSSNNHATDMLNHAKARTHEAISE